MAEPVPPSESAPSMVAHASYRHALPVRLGHWLNLWFVVVMLGSGLQIFNAHPALYWGSRSDPDRAWLAMSAVRGPKGEPQGATTLFGQRMNTTGLLGLSTGASGVAAARGFPEWATIPGPQWLAMGRRWHFFFAWLLVINSAAYLAYSLGSRHLGNDLLPSGSELKGIGGSLRHHLRLRTLRAQSVRGYNVLQKLSYLFVVLGLGPLLLLTGLTMSPWLDSGHPWLLDLFGGRQSARSLHFIGAGLLVTFVVVHVTMVLLVGPVRHLRAMITGWLREDGV